MPPGLRSPLSCPDCGKEGIKDNYNLSRHRGSHGCPGRVIPPPAPPTQLEPRSCRQQVPPLTPLPPAVLLKPGEVELETLLRQCSLYPIFAVALQLNCPVKGIFPVLWGWCRNDPAGQQVREFSCTTNPGQLLIAILQDAAQWGVKDIKIPVNIRLLCDGENEVDISKHLKPRGEVSGLVITEDQDNVTFSLACDNNNGSEHRAKRARFEDIDPGAGPSRAGQAAFCVGPPGLPGSAPACTTLPPDCLPAAAQQMAASQNNNEFVTIEDCSDAEPRSEPYDLDLPASQRDVRPGPQVAGGVPVQPAGVAGGGGPDGQVGGPGAAQPPAQAAPPPQAAPPAPGQPAGAGQAAGAAAAGQPGVGAAGAGQGQPPGQPPAGGGGHPPGPPGGQGGGQQGGPGAHLPRPFRHQANDLNLDWDVHHQERIAATRALDQDFTNREIWWILSGKRAPGPPDIDAPAFQNNRFVGKFINKLLFPHLMTDEEFIKHFKETLTG